MKRDKQDQKQGQQKTIHHHHASYWPLVITGLVLLAGVVAWLAAGEAVIQAARVVVWALAGAVVVATSLGLWLAWWWARRKRAELRRDLALADAEAASAWVDVDAKRLLLPLLARQIAAGRAVPVNLAGVATQLVPAQVLKEVQTELPAPEAMPELLPEIIEAQRILIVGGQGSGKTTLMQWIAAERLGRGQVLLLDSHDFPAKWPAGCNVVGNGREYGMIADAMRALVELMKRRYRDYSSGRVAERAHPLVTTMADEWTLLAEYIPDIGDFLGPIMTESRKVAIDLVIGTHSETARSLGLKGRYDLKKNFDVVVRLHRAHGRRWASADFGEGEQDYTLPGPFVVPGLARRVDDPGELAKIAAVVAEEPEPEAREPSPREQIVLEMYDGGASFNQISKEINEGRRGGTYNDEIKVILSKFGRL